MAASPGRKMVTVPSAVGITSSVYTSPSESDCRPDTYASPAMEKSARAMPKRTSLEASVRPTVRALMAVGASSSSPESVTFGRVVSKLKVSVWLPVALLSARSATASAGSRTVTSPSPEGSTSKV